MSTQSILSALRNQVLRDPGSFFTSLTQGDGQLQVVDLPVELVDPASLSVVRTVPPSPPQTLAAGQGPGQGDYYLYERDGVLYLTVPLAQGASLQVNGVYYKLFPTDDLLYYIQTAFLQHVHGKVPPQYLDFPDPHSSMAPGIQQQLPVIEEYIVALEAALEGIWSKIVEAADEVNVVVPDGVSIPDSSRYQQLTDLEQRLFDERTRLATQLNVGLDRIEMFTLRRVSRTTGRFVPEYVAREFDDRNWPIRQIPGVDQDLTSNYQYVGAWNNATRFYPNQLVDRDAANRFVCLQENVNIDPLVDVAQAATPGVGTYWANSTINTAWQGNAGW